MISEDIKKRIKKVLSKEQGTPLTDSEFNEQIKVMNKAAIMDKYLASFEKELRSSEILYAVKSIFDIDLAVVPALSREVIDSKLNYFDKKFTGPEIRSMINEIFGVNLDAISALEGSRISLYSKEQWVVQNETDLFVVHTSNRDIDAKVYPTQYFIEKTGLEELPDELKHSLTSIGYCYDEKRRSYYYSNPSCEPVPDAFKGRTMGAIMEVIRYSYSNL